MIIRFLQMTAIATLLIGCVHAQELLSNLPSCALSCVTSFALQHGCDLASSTCLCTHQLWPGISNCTESKCTTIDGLSSHRIAGQACGIPPRNKSSQLLVVCIVFASISSIFMAIRVTFRSLKHWELWGWDDALIVLCVVTGLPITALDILIVQHGFGQDIWEVSPDDINSALFCFLMLEVSYVTSTLLMKLSILAFYLRVFVDECFRKRVFVAMGFCLTFAVSFLAVGLSQCRPFPYIWLRWDDQRHGTCLSIASVVWGQAAINILLDIAILALPVPMLAGLHFQYSWKSKAQMAVMFGVGLLVTLVSILRLRTLVVFAHTKNQTWDYFGAALWSTIEVHVGIVCTCLPAARAFLTRFLPKWLSEKTKTWRETDGISTQPASQMQVLPSKVTTVTGDAASQLGDTIRATEKGHSGDSEHAMYDEYRKEWI